MRVMAQVAMVMALDKCIGCHTCSVTCKQAWTNRAGTEYVWFNNVETRPGQGYPRRYEDQEKWKGGWEINRRGNLKLKSGGRWAKLAGLFASPVQPELDDYYEPWTYDYETLTNAPAGTDFPVARPKSLITGEDMKISWSANWDDNLGGAPEMGHLDTIVEKVRKESEEKIKFEFEQTFAFYLPRICEHCLNPSCMASCPSGAIYKRTEDGIVLVDQDKCRGWRQCVTGCPYKKMYYNHKSGKAEKCTFCYPRIEVGIPTVCAETCVGRLRYIGIFLYDADRVTEAAATPDEQDLYEAQLDLMLDPHDPTVIAAARAEGIPEDWLDAARKSPVYTLAKELRVALPLHPEYRTMPMVWYVPPLSPVVDLLKDQGHDGEDAAIRNPPVAHTLPRHHCGAVRLRTTTTTTTTTTTLHYAHAHLDARPEVEGTHPRTHALRPRQGSGRCGRPKGRRRRQTQTGRLCRPGRRDGPLLGPALAILVWSSETGVEAT